MHGNSFERKLASLKEKTTGNKVSQSPKNTILTQKTPVVKKLFSEPLSENASDGKVSYVNLFIDVTI